MSDNALPAISPEHASYLRQRKRYRTRVMVSRILLLAGIIVLWEAAAELRLVNPFITSQPTRIVRTLLMLHDQGVLYRHISITVFETVVGFTLGTVAGTAIAVVLWWSDFLADVLDPYLVVLNSLPKIALGPIIIVWMGQGMTAIITMALLISLVVTILGVYSGFAQVDPDKVKLLRTFGAGKAQILRMVILPSSVPTIVSALKINVGLSWVGVIVGEFLVSRAGLGYLIVYGGQVFRLDLVMTSVIILAAAAALMYQAVVWFERMVLRSR
jgi:NitT/TauT family transport system permease protein